MRVNHPNEGDCMTMQQHLLLTSPAAEKLRGLMNDGARVNDAGHRSVMRHLLGRGEQTTAVQW